MTTVGVPGLPGVTNADSHDHSGGDGAVVPVAGLIAFLYVLAAAALLHTVIVENRHDSKNVHNVPEEKIEQMVNRFQIKL
jgi:hypothetical protein